MKKGLLIFLVVFLFFCISVFSTDSFRFSCSSSDPNLIRVEGPSFEVGKFSINIFNESGNNIEILSINEAEANFTLSSVPSTSLGEGEMGHIEGEFPESVSYIEGKVLIEYLDAENKESSITLTCKGPLGSSNAYYSENFLLSTIGLLFLLSGIACIAVGAVKKKKILLVIGIILLACAVFSLLLIPT